MAASGNNTGAVALFRNAASRSATYLIPLTVFLLIAAKPFILTLFSSKYTNSVTPFRLYLLILPLRVAQYGPMLTALGLTNIIMIRSWAGMISNCVLSIFFVYLWGYIGAIIATIVTLYGVNFVWNMSAISKASQTKWMQIFPFKEIGILAMISIFAGLPGIVILKFFGTQVKPVFMLGMQSVIFAVTLIFLARLLKITPLIAELNKQYNFIKTKISSLQKKQYYKI
jgi:O-antigen/teichoic acid export membrane protein